MFNVILAMDNNFGIGYKNQLPWQFSKDMKFFRTTTINKHFFDDSIVIMGRKTMESLPKKFLPNRVNIVISSNLNNEDSCIYVSSFEEALTKAYEINSKHSNNIWVIGGGQVYNRALTHNDLNLIYCTQVEGEFDCDVFVKLPNVELIKNIQETDMNKKNNQEYKLNFNILKPILNAEQQYLKLLNDVFKNGEQRMTRNGITFASFSKELKFDVSKEFPLLTTKRMFWRGIVEELLFFIRGETDTTKLSEKGIRIWNGNTTRRFLDSLNLDYDVGDMGPMYGYQWRFFNKPYQSKDQDNGIDQFRNLINDIKNNPTSRRLLMTDYNPAQVSQGVLYPCHSLILQFYVHNENLSVKMYQRSADLFLGLPFNIASTSLLLYIVASLTNLKPHQVTITLGDCHIYEEHVKVVKEQLSRTLFPLPQLYVPDFNTIEEVEKSCLKDYTIKNYQHHPSIKAKMIA